MVVRHKSSWARSVAWLVLTVAIGAAGCSCNQAGLGYDPQQNAEEIRKMKEMEKDMKRMMEESMKAERGGPAGPGRNP